MKAHDYAQFFLTAYLVIQLLTGQIVTKNIQYIYSTLLLTLNYRSSRALPDSWPHLAPNIETPLLKQHREQNDHIWLRVFLLPSYSAFSCWHSSQDNKYM